MSDLALILKILNQIVEAGSRVERRFAPIEHPDDFMASEDGLDRLDAICMMVIAIGESLKNLDKMTEGKLLDRYPGVDWVGAKGMRDIISHHYSMLTQKLCSMSVGKNSRTSLPSFKKSWRISNSRESPGMPQ